MNIIGTGLTGLVGSRVVELLSPKHSFTSISLETGVDITDAGAVDSFIAAHPGAPWLLHFAAYTNVQGAEGEKNLGEKSAAWRVNVAATEHIVAACKKAGKKMLYVDTDYAFDGKSDIYTEDDAPNPLGWYAITKSEGAKRVLAMGGDGLVIRISNPYRANPVGKTDFVHKMMERLANGSGISAPDDQLFVPTFIDDIAGAVDVLLEKQASGIYHIVGSTPISPFGAAKEIAAVFGFDAKLVTPTTFTSYFAGRAPVPQKAVLSGEKAKKLGIVMHGFADGLREVQKQEKV